MTLTAQQQHIIQTTTSVVQRPVQPIATRNSCSSDGIGLSHYILIDKKVAA